MEKYSITITRQFGSMGRLIGQKVAEKLGFAYYDRDIIESAAPLAGENLETLAKYDGQDFSSNYVKMAYPLGYGNKSLQKKLFEAEKSIILEHARYENCVFIGRCSDYILRSKENQISFFIYAPYEERLNNCKKQLKLTDTDAIKYISKVDRARESFYKLITKSEFDNIENRNFLIDSSVIGTEKTSDLIANIAKTKFNISSETRA